MKLKNGFICIICLILLLCGAGLTSSALAEQTEGESAAEPAGTVTEESADEEVFAGGITVQEKSGRVEEPLNLKKDTIVSNFYIGDVPLGGMTLQEAQDTVTAVLNRLSDTNFVMQSSYRSDFCYGAYSEDLGITYNLESAMKSVQEAVQRGSVLERYIRAKDYQREPGSANTELTIDEGQIMDYYNYVLPYWNCGPESAYVSYVDGNVCVTRGKVGVQFDFSDAYDQMFRDIRSLDYETSDDNIYYIQINETPTDPVLNYAKACEMTVIGSYTTSFHSPDTEALANRMQNVITSAAHMNGSTIAPGAQGSALTMYGPVDEEHGYKESYTFNEGQHVLDIGGGICQTTTTLYNALLMAELQINYRRNHSMMVTYVEPSRDATVYYPSSDFLFTNNTSDYISIGAWVDTSNYTLTVTIFGHEDHAPDHTVRYETEFIELTPPVLTCVDDPTKALGWDNVTTKVSLQGTDGPTCGVKSQLWKITTDNGVETRTLQSGPDTYNPCGAVYECAPDSYCSANTNGTLESGYVSLNLTFLDGTPLGSNPATWSYDQTNQFNNRMYNLLQSKGYTWPYGSGTPAAPPAEPLPEQPPAEPVPDPAAP